MIYYALCKDHIIANAKYRTAQIKELDSSNVDVNNFSTHLSAINQSNFLFFGFVHGSSRTMTINGVDHFISTSENYYILSNAFALGSVTLESAVAHLEQLYQVLVVEQFVAI